MATQCTLLIAAFEKASEQKVAVAVASYTFASPEDRVTLVPAIQAVLPGGFESVYIVTVIEHVPAVDGLGIDNLEYTVSI